MDKVLIIEIPYGGLGDHLFHSHLPRIAKDTGSYSKVLISRKSLVRHPDNWHLVWELNPFIDGFTDDAGITCDLSKITMKLEQYTTSCNLLDEVMLSYGMDDGKRGHEPELFYTPVYNKEFNKIIFDPNYLSWVGEVTNRDMMRFIKKKKFHFDAIMKIRTEKALYIPNGNEFFIETNSLTTFCDLIFSCKKLYCLTSGTATIAAALKKPATVFYGHNQSIAFQHSKLHQYLKVPKNPLMRLGDKIKFFLKR